MQDDFLKYEKEYLEIVSRNIRTFRRQAKYSQEFLAEKVNCSREFLNRVENQKEKPGLNFLLKLSYILGIPISDFFIFPKK